MKLDLDLFLSLLWMFVALSEAVTNVTSGHNVTKVVLNSDLKLNFTTYYHDELNLLYEGSPAQGVCSAPMVGGDRLFLTVVSKDYKVVGQYALHSFQYIWLQKMKGLIVKRVFVSWANETYGRVPGLAFKFCVREFLVFHCYFIQEKPNMSNEAFGYYVNVTRPRKPLLMVSYHLKKKQLIEGEILNVACAAVVGTGGKLMIILTGRPGHRQLNWTITYLAKTLFEDTSGHISNLKTRTEMTEQGPRIIAWLRMPVTKSMSGRWFLCISSNYGESLTERALQPKAKVRTIPYKPNLTVESSIPEFYNVWHLIGNCSSTDTNSSALSMVLRTADQTTVFTNIPDATGFKSYNKKQFINRRYSGAQSYFSVSFWTENKKNGLYLHMAAVLSTASEWAVVTCRVRDIQVCHHFRPTAFFALTKTRDYLMRTPMLLTIVIFSVLGLVVCLLLTITMKAYMDLYRAMKDNRSNY